MSSVRAAEIFYVLCPRGCHGELCSSVMVSPTVYDRFDRVFKQAAARLRVGLYFIDSTVIKRTAVPATEKGEERSGSGMFGNVGRMPSSVG